MPTKRKTTTKPKSKPRIKPVTRPLPTGTITGYKKCQTASGYAIVTLTIPKAAKRFIPVGARRDKIPRDRYTMIERCKCRAEYAIVKKIEDAIDKAKQLKQAHSFYEPTFIYRVGQTVSPPLHAWRKFDPKRAGCGIGIHFFLKKECAHRY